MVATAGVAALLVMMLTTAPAAANARGGIATAVTETSVGYLLPPSATLTSDTALDAPGHYVGRAAHFALGGRPSAPHRGQARRIENGPVVGLAVLRDRYPHVRDDEAGWRPARRRLRTF